MAKIYDSGLLAAYDSPPRVHEWDDPEEARLVAGRLIANALTQAAALCRSESGHHERILPYLEFVRELIGYEQLLPPREEK